MSIHRKTAIAAAMAGLVFSVVLPAAAAPQAGVPPWVGRAQNIGVADSNKTVLISAHLSFRNMAGLKALAGAVSTRGNPQYGHYLTPAQFRQRFAPLPADVATVRTALAKLGFAVGHSPASGFYVEATGTVGQIRSAFHVSQNLYRFQGKVLRANAQPPTLPAAMAGLVTYIGGLSDRTAVPDHIVEGARRVAPVAKPALRNAAGVQPDIEPEPWTYATRTFCSNYWDGKMAAVSPTPAPYPSSLAWAVCGYTPQQMRAAYGITYPSLQFLDGTGITIAIVDAYASPYIEGSADHYFRNHRVKPDLTSANFSQIVPKGIYKVSAGEPCEPQGWFDEETLDVEAAHSIAPGANIVYVGSRDCDVSLDDALYDAIDNHIADIITNSWGYEGEQQSSDDEATAGNAAFLEASVLGVSVLFSSGDNGDTSQVNPQASGSWPATSPYVTAVGGTTLALRNYTGKKQEWGWGTYTAIPDGDVATVSSDGSTVAASFTSGFFFQSGSGGGPSLSQPQPTWQQGIVPSSLSSFTYDFFGTQYTLPQADRVTPDISMDADPQSGFLIGETFAVNTTGGDPGCVLILTNLAHEYCEYAIGGPSLASPLFAGVLALVNEKRLGNSLPVLGFVNPRLYALTPGAAGTPSAITDVAPPPTLIAVLRGFNFNSPYLPYVRLRTINSQPPSRNGADDVSLNTTVGYDNVTGLGTPWVPALLTALGIN